LGGEGEGESADDDIDGEDVVWVAVGEFWVKEFREFGDDKVIPVFFWDCIFHEEVTCHIIFTQIEIIIRLHLG